jgi:thiol-disulfide isomerase/thioredoxin
MKKLLLILMLTFSLSGLYACSNAVNEPEMAVGQINQEVLLTQYPSFNREFSAYIIDEKTIAAANQWTNELSIEVYFGTWCHDSEREVPRLLKLLSQNKQVAIKLIALDYQKQEPKGTAQNKQIKYTPTFIVYKNNVEIGRIVERPRIGLAEDIASFL